MSEGFLVRTMEHGDIPTVVGLQACAFPPPFDPELHWSAEHIAAHLDRFPVGQFVAVADGEIVASCSNTVVAESVWSSHLPWFQTVGGPFLDGFDPNGSTLYGLDIAVHPAYRRRGVGRALYAKRFALVRQKGMARYGTACRLPGYAMHASNEPGATVEGYVRAVLGGLIVDRTLTPLPRMGLVCLGVVHRYMEDPESGHAAALLEWRP